MADFVSASNSPEALLNQGFCVYANGNTIIGPIIFCALVCDRVTQEANRMWLRCNLTRLGRRRLADARLAMAARDCSRSR
jgi:hypothetical protein